MTAQELNKAFAYNFSDNALNFRVFENDELKVIIRKEGDNFQVTIKYLLDSIDDEHFNADESYVLYLINEIDLVLQDYNEDQQKDAEQVLDFIYA